MISLLQSGYSFNLFETMYYICMMYLLCGIKCTGMILETDIEEVVWNCMDLHDLNSPVHLFLQAVSINFMCDDFYVLYC